jgi:integrase
MLKVIFDYAVERKLLLSNPVAKSKSYNTFHLILLLLTRKTEMIHGLWGQVNLDDVADAKYAIDASKTGAKLLIPLPHQAVSLLQIIKNMASRELGRNIEATDYIFMGKLPNAPMCRQTLNRVTDLLNWVIFAKDSSRYFTIHDLRRTATTNLGEMGYPSDYIEVALNHTKGGIKQVYHRSQYLDQRREMLQQWADKIDRLIGADLLPYGKKFVI